MVRPSPIQAGKLGQQGHGGNDHCVHLVAFQLGGTCIGDHDRQKIEGCVCNVEHDLIQVAAFVHPARHGQQGEQGLDQAAAGNHADQRLESANQEIEHKVADLLFGGRCIVVRDDACTLQLTGFCRASYISTTLLPMITCNWPFSTTPITPGTFFSASRLALLLSFR